MSSRRPAKGALQSGISSHGAMPSPEIRSTIELPPRAVTPFSPVGGTWYYIPARYASIASHCKSSGARPHTYSYTVILLPRATSRRVQGKHETLLSSLPFGMPAVLGPWPSCWAGRWGGASSRSFRRFDQKWAASAQLQSLMGGLGAKAIKSDSLSP